MAIKNLGKVVPVKGEDYFTQEDIASLGIPHKTSELTNDSGFLTLTDLPEAGGEGLPVFAYTERTDFDFRTQPIGIYYFNDLGSVYLPDGGLYGPTVRNTVLYYIQDYKNLTTKETIAYFATYLKVNSSYLQRVDVDVIHDPTANDTSVISSSTDLTSLVTKTSQLTNDSKFVDETYVNNLVGAIADELDSINGEEV